MFGKNQDHLAEKCNSAVFTLKAEVSNSKLLEKSPRDEK